MNLARAEMVEVFKTEPPDSAPITVIAVAYHSENRDLERDMRNAHALFDTPIEGMSKDMVKFAESAWHRVAVLQVVET